MTSSCGNTAFDARHGLSPCSSVELQALLGQHLRHVTHIGLMHIYRTAQVAFIFGGFLGQNVAFESLTAFNSSTWTNAKAFFRAALGLHLGHFHAPYGFA
jgi:hypothetical protein